MRLPGSTVLPTLALWLLLPADLPTTEQADPAVQQRQMELAALYERLHAWDNAEAQFVAAAQGPSKELRERALQGIERIRELAAMSSDSSSLKLGNFYERQGMWSDSEREYLAGAKDGSGEVQRLALEGLKRVRDQMPRSRLAESLNSAFDLFSGLVSRGLAIVGVLVGIALLGIAIWRVREIRRRIEVLPFFANKEMGGTQITYWLGYTQAMVRSAGALPSAASTSVNLMLPYLQLPGLAEQLPELGEFSIGGVKVPAGELLRGMGRPRVRVSGGWIVDTPQGRVFAKFERRRGFSRYETYTTIKRVIQANQQDEDLELFAYHILIKAAETYVS